MINTFFHLGALNTPAALLTSLLIGIAFGVALENAGFGSSRRLAGIFYFRDMAVLKVMFTAVVIAMIGISYAKAFGWVTTDNVYFLHTLYAAQIVGGLMFGVGFVMSGWCPGTGAVGLASGKIDALVFLIGATGGSMLYNEIYPLIGALTSADRGVVFAYDALGVSEATLAFGLTLIAVGCFWGSEYIEKTNQGTGEMWGTPFLKVFSVILITGAFGLFAVANPPASSMASLPTGPQEALLLEGVEGGRDHMGPQELADRLIAMDPLLLLVDIRPPEEFAQFHLRSAINIPVAHLAEGLSTYKNKGLIVLYSNGMTHPAQARDSLFRLGFTNVYFLTDGLDGFLAACLKPISLRAEPVSPPLAMKINAWRTFFLTPAPPTIESQPSTQVERPPSAPPPPLPGLIETEWLNTVLGTPDLKIIDLRGQPEYNTGHIPGSLSLNVENLRGNVHGVPSSLLPGSMLAEHVSMMGIAPEDLLVFVCTDKLQDATLAGMACERLGHTRYGILQGGFPKWSTERRPIDTILPSVKATSYPVPTQPDSFTVTAAEVMTTISKPGTLIIDVRPTDYFTGKKQDEARGGHIPGAINRPFSDDVINLGTYNTFKPQEELRTLYGALIPTLDSPVIVHCRTGHQASQTYFVLTRLLGYTRVKWFDAGWTQWAATPTLPVQ
ncbi:hypothetical protein DSLASN_47540 [Desulfoluna limicola]|uniref:Rhodanese domain-containing protein n=1 Tax=Desulfoluna limicola TaxID=2810562 RepID=A0ABM7PP78_9BACT|nr:rhodanese-like domain-containing protein [Desulfoluna limicola]BCS99122.1 hypothetical protein DSLASN_47540 [Desulfoluna limicola]